MRAVRKDIRTREFRVPEEATPTRIDRHQEDKDRPGDRRSRAQRDRDRLLHCSAFRRLAGVTQVIGAAEEGFLLHNRLTHSLKVAQVARRIAERRSALQRSQPGPQAGPSGASHALVSRSVDAP